MPPYLKMSQKPTVARKLGGTKGHALRLPHSPAHMARVSNCTPPCIVRASVHEMKGVGGVFLERI